MSRFISVLEASTKLTLAGMEKDKYGNYNRGYDIPFFGRTYKGRLSVDKIKNDTISDIQKKRYADFITNNAKYSKAAFKKLLAYIEVLGDYGEYFETHDKPKTEKEMGDLVKPYALVVNGDRNLILVCNAVWDDEHGVTIQILPNVDCGDLGNFF